MSKVVFEIMRGIDLDVRVLSMSGSIGIPCESDAPSPLPPDAYRLACTPLKYAVENATAAGIVFVAAAGNENANCPDGEPGSMAYPAAYPEVVAVGAAESIGSLAVSRWSDGGNSGSNCGPELDLLAPSGPSAISTTPLVNLFCNGQAYCTLPHGKTSLATPVVSGAAALVIAKCRLVTREETIALLEENARHLTSLQAIEQGHGLLQLNATLQSARSC